MKGVEINGVVLTEKALEIIFQLQNNTGMKEMYLDMIDEITRTMILNIEPDDIPENVNFARIRALTMLRCDIEELSKTQDEETDGDE